ncbi:HMG-box protein STE11 [Psilocybe cubensis]|uniref:HMG box domain-containing protein n=2 Tax=Psilocybe cubensis TaxID=181762 RepID=A0A8H8CG28_PSICU|nr:HMG-box protein STE11 [Psilocybe cubensis]KAH9475097.1 HMG-box protein STE11 [Psilocybe cubensis]
MENWSHDGPHATLAGSQIKQVSRKGFKPASDFVLPDPTYPTRPDAKKKSHARKRPPGHIPRPRNAFILFRCDFVRQKRIPESVENDHRNISRIIGRIWNQMSEEQQKPWQKMAAQEKINHHKIYPDYRFTSGSTKKNPKRGGDSPRKGKRKAPPKELEEVSNLMQRAESCPPGAPLVPQAIIENNEPAYGDPLVTRDDLSRRPSCVKLYRSAPYDFNSDGQAVGYFEDLSHQHYYAQAMAAGSAIPVANKQEGTGMSDGNALFCGPRLDAVQYAIPDSTTPPEWEASTPPSDLDSFHQDDYSRPPNNSVNFNQSHFLPASEALFNDPFNPVLASLSSRTSLPHYSLTGEILNPIAAGLYIPRSDLQGDETASELADDMISEFTRNFHGSSRGQNDF